MCTIMGITITTDLTVSTRQRVRSKIPSAG